MKKIISPLILVACLLSVIGCIGKDEETFINGKISMMLLDGGNQSEVIGKTLTKRIKVQILKDDKPFIMAGTFAAFKQHNCLGTSLVKVFLDGKGIAEYVWRLDDVVGTQRLVVYAYQNDISLDSIIVNATGLDVNKTNFNVSSCLPDGNYELERGDNTILWATNTYNRQFSVSKNGGRSWQQQSASFPYFSSLQGNKNDVFWTSLDSFFSSKDGGLTYKVTQPFEFKGVLQSPNLFLTQSSKIIAYVPTPSAPTILASLDKGANWTKSTGIDVLKRVVETASGRLFCVGDKNNLPTTSVFYSDDAGQSWKPVWNNIGRNNDMLAFADNLFVNSKNELYLFSWTKNQVIYKSTDNGATWIFVKNNSSVLNGIQEDNGQIYYLESFNNWQHTLYRTTNFVTTQSLGEIPVRIFSISNGVIAVPYNNNVYYKSL